MLLSLQPIQPNCSYTHACLHISVPTVQYRPGILPDFPPLNKIHPSANTKRESLLFCFGRECKQVARKTQVRTFFFFQFGFVLL